MTGFQVGIVFFLVLLSTFISLGVAGTAVYAYFKVQKEIKKMEKRLLADLSAILQKNVKDAQQQYEEDIAAQHQFKVRGI